MNVWARLKNVKQCPNSCAANELIKQKGQYSFTVKRATLKEANTVEKTLNEKYQDAIEIKHS